MNKKKSVVSTIHSLHPRIGASFALILLTIGMEMALLAVFALLCRYLRFGDVRYVAMGLLLVACPVIVFYGGCLLIWFPVVQRTRSKVLKTVYLSAGLASLTIAVGFAGSILGVGRSSALAASLIGGAVAIILFNVVWWTPPHLRPMDQSVPCVNCGYDLRGQRVCRCPECGREFTVAELVAPYRDVLD